MIGGAATAGLLALAWLGAINAAASCLAWTIAARVAAKPGGRGSGALLALRLMPAGLSTLFVAGIFLPAHWRFEPRGSDESFGAGVYLCAALGAFVLARGASRLAAVIAAGWRLRASVPAARRAEEVYEVDGIAGVSLAGLFRPRILVGPLVRQTLSSAELDVAVAHERAHREALDNVKRCAMFCAPDLFGYTAAARRLEQLWSATAEWQADARAVRGDESRAVHLASALVKVARLTTSPAAWGSPAWSTLHDGPLLESRVRRLTAGSPPVSDVPGRVRPMALGAAAAVTAILSVAALYGGAVHAITEAAAHLLP